MRCGAGFARGSRGIDLCVSLALSSLSPLPVHHSFHLVLSSSLVLALLVLIVLRAKWGPRENDHVPNHPSGIGEI